jgi:hypothetical protein
MKKEMIKLGARYRDKVTHFEGVAVSYTKFMHGCLRIALQDKVDKEGRLVDPQMFDEPDLELVDTELVAQEKKRSNFGDPGFRPLRNRIEK